MGTDSWSQCNDTPVKFARFPVTGLIEGRSYIFRVRAVNKTGIGLPSRVSEPVAALDPAEKARLKSKHFSFFRIILNFFYMPEIDPIARLFLHPPLEGEENKKSFTGQRNPGEKKTKTKKYLFFDSSVH